MRYHIERRIGAGGMAEVYEATLAGEAGFQRKVAIKRLALELVDDPSARQSFLDEARIAGSLNHAGIVAVVDYGIVDGCPVQVLEWIDGIDGAKLIQLAEREPLPASAACFIASEVARALDFAHRAEVIHRDTKPSNILISWSGHVKLADFGIAKARERGQRTRTGIAKGTAAFMAPEQRTGSAVDARSDVFALGGTLHALLTGASPIDPGAPPIDHELGRALTIDPAVPAQLREVIGRACEPNPAARYANMAAFERALDEAAREAGFDDGRRALGAWLDRARTIDRPRALLDDLQGLGLHMVLADDDGGSRAFRMEKAGTVVDPPRPRRRAWLAIPVALAAIAITAAVMIAHDDEPIAAPLVEAPVVDVTPPPQRPVVVPEPPAAVEPPPKRVVREVEPPRKVAAPVGRGFVAIGGSSVHLGEIAIDGARIGTAPRLVELAVGRHAIVVTHADGRRVGPLTVEVTERHTRARPLRPGF